jgi:pyruvate/2-oxoglutarate dehydrogenase complex dihydrolipoamide dehydrogenase (E3) component/uncharacterized membrane protein YdjX (TVP38/TMEM64 family)
MRRSKLMVFATAVILVFVFFAFDLHQQLSLSELKARQAEIDAFYQSNPLATAGLYFAIYVAVTGLSLPGATILTLAGGAIFGLKLGTVLVSFASTLGATVALLVSRFVFRDWVQTRFRTQLQTINTGVARDGAFYLFSLRLVPVVPFFAINLAMGLTAMPALRFAWVSQLGMLAGTIVYVNAGTQLGGLQSPAGLLSPVLIGSFLLLAVFPFLARSAIKWINQRKVYAGWTRPYRFDRNLVVIGAGSAGLVTAYIAAAVKAKVSLIERHKMGGDCLNTGCVPSKALLRSAKLLAHMRRSQEFGIRSAQADFDFAEVMQRVQRVIQEIEPHDSIDRYQSLGVECIEGEAKITSPFTVEVRHADGRSSTLSTRNIVIAAGARPFVPPIPGLAEVGPLTSDNVWNLRRLPRRLVVLGGGPIGCELTQAFARFGSQVTQVEMLPRLLIREDAEASDIVAARLRAEGVEVLTGHKATRVMVEAGEKYLLLEHSSGEKRVAFDEILCAVGRVANTAGYGLEELGVPLSPTRTVEVNEFLQTKYPNIFACGDVAGPYQFTHTAAHMAWYAAVNALFGRFKTFRVDYSVVPWCTFNDPDVARVGLNETEAKERGIAHEVTVYGIDDLDRAIADGDAHGYVKVITAAGSDRILGCTIVGEHAGDLLVEYVAAMRHGFGLNKILGTIHIYPTLAEANKFAAGVWRKAHAPQRVLSWVERYHRWQLG